MSVDSYDAMNIYQRLTQDHELHRELAGKLAETSGDTPERQAMWKQLRADCEAHAAAEEQTFYSSLIAEPDGQDKSRHSISEHKVLDELMAEIGDIDMSSPAWLMKFKDLRHKLEHHMEEEEDDVFVRARKLLSDQEAADLAEAFAQRKAEELKQ